MSHITFELENIFSMSLVMMVIGEAIRI